MYYKHLLRKCNNDYFIFELFFRFQTIGNNVVGFPKVHYFGMISKYNAMVLELLGCSLETLFKKCNYSFSMKTILQIAIQTIDRIQYVHSRGIIYR